MSTGGSEKGEKNVLHATFVECEGTLENGVSRRLDNRAGWRAAVFMRELLPVSRVSDLHLLQRFRNGAALSSVIPTNYTTILIKYELRAPDVPTLLVHCKIHVTAATERVSALLNLTKASGIK